MASVASRVRGFEPIDESDRPSPHPSPTEGRSRPSSTGYGGEGAAQSSRHAIASTHRSTRKTSAASATTTSRSTAGAAPRSTTSCASTTIFRARRSFALNETTEAPRHILAAASHLIAHNEGRLGKTLRTEDVPGEKVQVTSCWDSEEEARSIGDEIEQLQRDDGTGAAAQSRRDRDPGARVVPDARVRGPLRHARPALSRDRRPAVLRAHGDPRRARLSAAGRAAGRRSCFRAHRQRAQARARRRHRQPAARPRPQAAHAADGSDARHRRDRRDEAAPAQCAARAGREFRPLARDEGHRAARRAGADRAR